MVRVSDTIKQQNDLTSFPVAYGSDLWLDKNKGSGTPDYASIQALYNNGELGGGATEITTMPTASEDYLGKILHYVGESGTYKKGHFYECVYVPMEQATSPYKWMEVDHFRFNHVIYNSNTPPNNSDYTVGDIVFYTGKTMDDFTSGHYYRALPSDNPENVYTFVLGSTVYFSYTPFEFRLGFIVYPTGTGGEDHPYEITEITEEGITITPYGWTGEEQQFVSIYYYSEIRSWEDLGGGGGGNIFNGTMDEWNELTTEQKKEYDNLATPEEPTTDVVTVSNPFTRDTTHTQTASEIQAFKQGRIASFKVYVEFKNITEGDWNDVGTVVDAIKPLGETPLIISDGRVATAMALARIYTNGKVQVWGSSSLNTLSTRLSAMYFTAN